MKKHLPLIWLPRCTMTTIVVHWTAGKHTPTALDKLHYHFLVDGDADRDGNCVVHKGLHSIKANARPFKGIAGTYAAHTRKFNAASIGVALCGMMGAKESPFTTGPYPIKEIQWQTTAEVVAQLSDFYDIPVTYTGILQHGEVEENTGIGQVGKWDCNKLPWEPLWTPERVARDFRLRVKAAKERP